MNDAEVRGHLLFVLHERRHQRQGGWVQVSELDFSGGEPVSHNRILDAGRYLAQSNYIEWKAPVAASGPLVAMARINASGINIIERPRSKPDNIIIPSRAGVIGVESKGEAAGVAPPPPSFGVEAKGIAADLSANSSPPMGGLNQDDSASRVAIEAAARIQSNITGMGTFNPTPPLALNPDPRNISPLFLLDAEARQARFTFSILAQPLEIRNSVVRLAGELREQIADSLSRKPNDSEALQNFYVFLDFLETTAAALDHIAETLDRAIGGPDGKAPDRILAGEAAKAFDRLATACGTWFKANGKYLPGYFIKAGVFFGGCALLKYFDMDGIVHEGFLAWIVSNFPNEKPPKTN